MRHNRAVATLKMASGSVAGVLGFATLSSGFVGLNGGTMALGVGEILLGTFLAMGVMVPLRPQRSEMLKTRKN